jgi:hypothetical protein
MLMKNLVSGGGGGGEKNDVDMSAVRESLMGTSKPAASRPPVVGPLSKLHPADP